MQPTDQSPATCPQCKRKIAASTPKCIFCGAQLHVAAPPAPAPVKQAPAAAKPASTAAPRTPRDVQADMFATLQAARAAMPPEAQMAPPSGTEVTVAHYNATHKIFMVTVKGRSLNIPQRCACCLGSGEYKLEVAAEHATRKGTLGQNLGTITQVSFNFPVCGACQRHMNKDGLATLLSFGIAGGVFVAIVYALGQDYFLDAAARHTPTLRGMLTAAGLGFAALVAAMELNKWLEKMMPGPGAGHADRGRPVEANFAGFSGVDSPITFGFKNRQYGELFAKMNSARQP